MGDDTHVPNDVKFQAMINELKRHNTLVGQRFDETMVAQAEAQAKQLNFWLRKLNPCLSMPVS